MRNATTILLVGDDQGTAGLLHEMVDGIDEAHLLLALDNDEALVVGQKVHLDLIVAAYRTDLGKSLKLCRDLKVLPELEGSLFLVVADPGETELKIAGLDAGIDDYLTRPIDLSSLLPKFHRIHQMRKMERDLGSYRSEIDRLRGTLCRSKDEVLPLLAYLLDLRFPGAVDRGNRIADLALKLAVLFKIPRRYLPDLEIMAKLHEVGRIVLGDTVVNDRSSTTAADGWKYVLATRAILRQIRGLHEAAELVGCIYEDWDGTGMPEHLRQGQIPLRCRMVRILIDLMAALERPGNPGLEAILADMIELGGTTYDPGVVVHLRSLIEEKPDNEERNSRALLAITDLREGMVLADDLHTDAGIKLLARGTTLTRAKLDTILRRNKFDPILRGAFVMRKCA